MASAVTAGILIATFTSPLLFPVVYSLVHDPGEFMRFRTLMATGSALVVGAMSGCGPDEVVGISEDELFGTWAMVSTSGQSLPASITVEDCTFTIISEDITFESDLSFDVTSVTSLACGGAEPEPETELSNGTYRVRNGRLSLLFEGEFTERTIPVGITGSRLTLTLVQGGQTSLIVYERQ